MALTDEERVYWREQSEAGAKTPAIVAAIKARRVDPERPGFLDKGTKRTDGKPAVTNEASPTFEKADGSKVPNFRGDEEAKKLRREGAALDLAGDEFSESIEDQAREPKDRAEGEKRAFQLGRAMARGQRGLPEWAFDYKDQVAAGQREQGGHDDATGFAEFGLSMLAPGAAVGAARGARGAFAGPVARSAARPAGTVVKAIREIGIPHNIGSVIDSAKAGATLADETAAAVGRRLGVKPPSEAPAPKALTFPGAPKAAPAAKAKPAGNPRRGRLFSGIDLEGVPEAIEDGATARLAEPNFKPRGKISGDKEAGYSDAGGVETPTSENATKRIVTNRTPSDANVKPGRDGSGDSPRMSAYQQSLKDAEEAKFAKRLGKTVPEYREMLAQKGGKGGTLTEKPKAPPMNEWLSELIAKSDNAGWSSERLAQEITRMVGAGK